MARVLNDKKKLVFIKSSGPIVELGCLTGPIRSARVDVKTLMLMIQNGKVVYEINPAKPSEMVKLDMINVTKNNFEKISETKEMMDKKNNEDNNVRNVSVSTMSVTEKENMNNTENSTEEDIAVVSTDSENKVEATTSNNSQAPYYKDKNRNKKYQNDFKRK